MIAQPVYVARTYCDEGEQIVLGAAMLPLDKVVVQRLGRRTCEKTQQGRSYWTNSPHSHIVGGGGHQRSEGRGRSARKTCPACW